MGKQGQSRSEASADLPGCRSEVTLPHRSPPKCAQVQEKRGVINCPPQTLNVFENDTEKAIGDQVARS